MYGDDTEDEESHDDDQNNDDTIEETNDESDIVYDTDSDGDDNNDDNNDDANGNVLMNVDAENVVHAKVENGEERRKTMPVPRRYKDTNKNKDGSYSCLVE